MPTSDQANLEARPSNRTRAYDKLRTIIEKHKGQMTYRRGHNYWEICLNGKVAKAPTTGAKSFPDLDKYYVPDRPNPTTWAHYENELILNAEELFLAWVNQVG